MKALRSVGIFTAVVLSCICVRAGPATDKAEPAGYRVTVELKDGSRIIGTSRDEHYLFNSDSLGEMKLPLEKVRSVEGDKGNGVRLVTAAQDSLMVQFAMSELRVETQFGEVKLPVALIKNLHVSVIDKGRPTDGLIGFWSGDGNAVDSVGGDNGVNRNVSYVDGVAGKAFCISPNEAGARPSIDIADKPEFALTHSLSIDCWVRPRGDGCVIFSRGDRTTGFYTLSMERSHSLVFQLRSGVGQGPELRAILPYCVWTHVAGTLDGDAGVARLYTNGVLAAETKTDVQPTGLTDPETTPGIGIGNVNNGVNTFPFVGDIDEVALYNRALTAEEAKAIYDEHAATAQGRAEMLPGHTDVRNRIRPGLRTNLKPEIN